VIPKKMPKTIDFDNKVEYFKSAMNKLSKNYKHHLCNMAIRRPEVFTDSFNQIMNRSINELRGKLRIEFKNEEGEDAGGLTREWFLALSKEIFNPMYGLFIPSDNQVTYQPSPHSYINSEHLRYFKFIGRVVGKALCDGHLLDAYFTASLYKHMVAEPLTYHDIENIDPEYYKSLSWILENDITDLEIANFCYKTDDFGQIVEKELIPNGKNIQVTEENKHDYVDKVCYAKMATEIRPQIEAFLEGLYDLIPCNLLKVFDYRELELMISGMPVIDLKDLRNNTEYVNFTKDSQAIKWFWEI